MGQDSSRSPTQAEPAPATDVPDQPAVATLPSINIAERGDAKGVSEVTGQDLLRFARHILICLLVLSFTVMLMYYFSDRQGTNEVAAKEIFEVVKIGVLPLVSLVIGFYFRKTEK